MWAVKQVIRLCSLGEEHSLPSGNVVLDKKVVTSIRVAVDNLNAGIIACPKGMCIAYSASHQAYHLVYRSDMRDKVQSDFRRRSSSTVSTFANFAILDGAWSTKNVLRLCADGEEEPYLGVVPQLDASSITSVMDAVCKLNRGDIECPQGYCMVYSASRQAYYLLYHCQVKQDVLARFRPADNGCPPSAAESQRSLGRSPSASFSVSDIGTSGGDSWSSRRVIGLCGEGEERLFQGRAMVVTGSLSVSDAVAKLNRGDVDCPEGFCVVFSASRKLYFLLFRAGLRDIAVAACNGDVEPSLKPPVGYTSSPAPYTSSPAGQFLATTSSVSAKSPLLQYLATTSSPEPYTSSPAGQYLATTSPAVSALRQRALSQRSENKSWSSRQAFKVCAEGEELRFQGRVQVLDRAQVASVSEAVQILQGGDQCPEGLCMVFSATQQTWYLLYRADAKDNASGLLADLGSR